MRKFTVVLFALVGSVAITAWMVPRRQAVRVTPPWELLVQ
jgi:hypothetical protein